MTKKLLLFSLLLTLTFCTRQTDRISNLSGDYFGQKPDSSKPVIFAKEIISSGYHIHSGAVFTPDLNEVYYVVAGQPYKVIVCMKKKDGIWSEPFIPSFSGKYSDDHPSVSSDGNTIFFDSRRPLKNTGPPEEKSDIWKVTRNEQGWGEPVNPGEPVNTKEHEFHPSVAANGNLYFVSPRKDGFGSTDIYLSEFKEGVYRQPVNLGGNVNSPGLDAWIYIHPDEKYLLFSSFRRGDNLPEGIFFSGRGKDGVFNEATYLAEVNFYKGVARMPVLSPDGKYLFFNLQGEAHPAWSEKPLSWNEYLKIKTGPENGNGNIYWMDARFLNNYGNTAINN